MKLPHSFFKIWNFWPTFLCSGIKILKVSEDFRQISVKLKLRFWNANYVGTQYGGSIFSMADPFYMVMLIKNLGPSYSVWDKSAEIRFIKPGRTDLYAEFALSKNELVMIRQQIELYGKMEWVRQIVITDQSGAIVAEVTKVLKIKKK